MNKDQKRRTQANTRGIFIVLIAGSAVTLWADDIYQYILSLAALAAGVAIALKEFFLNVGGTFYRLFAKPFSVGDRIEVNGMRGDVVDVGIMSVLVMEVGPGNLTHNYTGRTITIPNSTFLTTAVSNENESAHHEGDFILHSFEVPIRNTPEWKKHYDTMLESAELCCEAYKEKAFDYFKKVTDKRQLEMPKTEPRINLKFKSPNEIDMIVRVSAPVARRGTIEQEIIRTYLNKVHK
tara:strand:+ start:10916 stop:11626 length:711 start_codon:yes stop_codon:yes gene_type:complete